MAAADGKSDCEMESREKHAPQSCLKSTESLPAEESLAATAISESVDVSVEEAIEEPFLLQAMKKIEIEIKLMAKNEIFIFMFLVLNVKKGRGQTIICHEFDYSKYGVILF